jgi:CRISPR system Cascade subunit CasA
MWNLLSDPVIRVTTSEAAPEPVPLPDVLARLSSQDHVGFPALMPHQAQAWHAFVVQLAALALLGSGRHATPTTAVGWRRLLRHLTHAHPDDSPWHLVVDALDRPAFMQPPVPERSLRDFGVLHQTPDGLDLLPTSKNHDVKATRIHHAGEDHWIFALVSLQTMAGVFGRGNYGISRMNGGYGSRSSVGIEHGPAAPGRFRRDLALLVEERDRILDDYPYYKATGGEALLWLRGWDGQTSLAPTRLDPYYIEICRRVRLQVDPTGHVVARTRPTIGPRISARELHGDTGDAWTPINVATKGALTVREAGFTYDLLSRVLFSPDFRPAPAQRVRRDDPSEGLRIVARVMVRGQGRTGGLHARTVPLPSSARSLLATPEGRDRLAAWAKRLVEDAGTAWRSALAPAIAALLQGGAVERARRRQVIPQEWRRRFDTRVDEAFFPTLWTLASEPITSGAANEWHRTLARAARIVLREAEHALPVPLTFRYRALARAERILERNLHTRFPGLAGPRPTASEVAP